MIAIFACIAVMACIPHPQKRLQRIVNDDHSSPSHFALMRFTRMCAHPATVLKQHRKQRRDVSSGKNLEAISACARAVATRMRTGAHARDAWVSSLNQLNTAASQQIHHGQPASSVLSQIAQAFQEDDERSAWKAIATTASIIERHGAPAADALDRLAQSLDERTEAVLSRRVALAGPKATAILLSFLPFVGLALGMLMKADPLSVLCSGGIGTVMAVVSLGLIGCGCFWMNRMAHRAAEGR